MTSRRLAIVAAAALAGASCTTTKECKDGTVLVTVVTPTTADTYDIEVTTEGGTTPAQVPSRGQATGTIEIDFRQYPARQRITIAVRAMNAGTEVASGQWEGTLGGACQAIRIVLRASDGTSPDGGAGGMDADPGVERPAQPPVDGPALRDGQDAPVQPPPPDGPAPRRDVPPPVDAGCAAGTHFCVGRGCVSDQLPTSCGPARCDTCPVPANASAATCDGLTCGVECRAGYHVCNGACVSNMDVATCGQSCTACTAPMGGSATCNGTSCGSSCPSGQKLCLNRCIPMSSACMGQCDAGFHDCSGMCLSNTSVNSCGGSCMPCPVPSGATMATCNGTSCDFVCPGTHNKCGTRCAPGNDITACGASCRVCPSPPANGTATCDGSSCDWSCRSGYNKCGTRCAANNDVTACGPSCLSCPAAPSNGSATCNGTSCDFSCNNGYNKCGNRCASSTDTTACGQSCTACPAPPPFGSAICSGGSCDFTCDSQHRKCGGVCVDHLNDKNNCGTCNNKCDAVTSSALCVAGVCEIDNYTRNPCRAQWIAWKNGMSILGCNVGPQGVDGWHQVVTSSVTLADGQSYAGPTIILHPPNSDGGNYGGSYPPIRVEAGSRFRARVGCRSSAPNCNMSWQVTYTHPGMMDIMLLAGNTLLTSPGTVQNIDVSLASLVGQDIEFNLIIAQDLGGAGPAYSTDDSVYWVNPRIERP